MSANHVSSRSENSPARAATGWQALVSLLCLLALASCGYELPVEGLRPIHPAMKTGTTYSLEPVADGYPVVNVRNFYLRWEPFTPPADAFTGPVRVSYDLRIWLVSGRTRGDLIFERTGLPNPWQRVEGVVRHNTRYFWSVRARIRMDGETRLTDWSRLASPNFPFNRGGHAAHGEIPDDCYYRFWTRFYGDDPSREIADRRRSWD